MLLRPKDRRPDRLAPDGIEAHRHQRGSRIRVNQVPVGQHLPAAALNPETHQLTGVEVAHQQVAHGGLRPVGEHDRARPRHQRGPRNRKLDFLAVE
jgi:hypothetical protein